MRPSFGCQPCQRFFITPLVRTSRVSNQEHIDSFWRRSGPCPCTCGDGRSRKPSSSGRALPTLAVVLLSRGATGVIGKYVSFFMDHR